MDDNSVYHELEAALNQELGILSKSLPVEPNGLLSVEQQAKRREIELAKQCKELHETYKLGLGVCFTTLQQDLGVDTEKIKQELQEAFGLLSSRSEIERLAKEFIHGKSWTTLLNIPSSIVEQLYRAAKFLAELQRYQEGKLAFSSLTLLDHSSSSFWLGLGLCHYHLKQFERAQLSFKAASDLRPESYWFHLYQADCLVELGDSVGVKREVDLADQCYQSANLSDSSFIELLRQMRADYERRF